jgi:hypothetical protein
MTHESITLQFANRQMVGRIEGEKKVLKNGEFLCSGPIEWNNPLSKAVRRDTGVSRCA